MGLPVQRKKKPWICLPPGCTCLYKHEIHIENIINYISFVEENDHFKGCQTTEIGSINKYYVLCIWLKSLIDIELHDFDDLTKIILFRQNHTHSHHAHSWPLQSNRYCLSRICSKFTCKYVLFPLNHLSAFWDVVSVAERKTETIVCMKCCLSDDFDLWNKRESNYAEGFDSKVEALLKMSCNWFMAFSDQKRLKFN